MKIGIVCYPTVGGSGIVATELGIALADKGHKVHFIASNKPYRFIGIEKNITFHQVIIPDYPLFESHAPYVLALTSKLVDVIKYEKLDIMHVHYAIPHATASYLAKQILASEQITIPFLTTLHGTDITIVGKDPSYASVVTFSINQSDEVTSVSESLKNETLEHFKIVKDIKVIPNFVNLDRFKRVFNAELRLNYALPEEKILVHASNFRKVKRVGDVIEIFKEVRKKVRTKLLMIGDGPEHCRLEQECRDSGLCRAVHFVGIVSSLEQLLSISDVFLLPSQTESFGLAALEAMACQVPVVSSNSGGLPEVNLDGYSGFNCEVGDIEQMASRSIEILNNLEIFKIQALEQATKFKLNNVLPRYEALYSSLYTSVATHPGIRKSEI